MSTSPIWLYRLVKLVLHNTRAYALLGAQVVLRACECLGVQDVWLIGQGQQSDVVFGVSQPPDAPASPAASEGRQSVAAGPASVAEDSAQWLTVRSFANAAACIAALQEQRCVLWCTALTQSAEDLYAVVREGSPMNSRSQQSSRLPADDHSGKATQPGGAIAAGVPQPSTIESGIAVSDGSEAPPQRLAVAFSGSEAEGVSRELLDAAHKLVYLPLHGGRTPRPSHNTHPLA